MEGDEGVEVSSQCAVIEEVILNEELSSRVAEGSHVSKTTEAHDVEGIVSSISSVSVFGYGV